MPSGQRLTHSSSREILFRMQLMDELGTWLTSTKAAIRLETSVWKTCTPGDIEALTMSRNGSFEKHRFGFSHYFILRAQL